MSKTFDKPIIIQRIDPATEEWTDAYDLHASVNKSKADNEYLGGGAVQAKQNLTFEVRYYAALEEIAANTQSFRVLYRNIPYNIIDFDDFMQQHKTVKLSGVSY